MKRPHMKRKSTGKAAPANFVRKLARIYSLLPRVYFYVRHIYASARIPTKSSSGYRKDSYHPGVSHGML
jgi:hypothetical protein